jgi:hypothetical protein
MVYIIGYVTFEGIMTICGLHGYYTLNGHAIAQAVSYRLPTAAARVQIRGWSCGIL